MVDKLYQEPLAAEDIRNPLSDQRTKHKLIKSLYGFQGFAKQHIDSFDEFINYRISEIITSKMNRRVISDSVPDFWLEYNAIRVCKPTHERNYDTWTRNSDLYPHEARTSNMSYSADILYFFLNAVSILNTKLETKSKKGRILKLVECRSCSVQACVI